MFVRKFLAWAANAPAAERAPAAASLARALLNGELPNDEEYEAGVALAAFADDPSPLVRRALAIEIAPRADAPHQILIALAGDQPEVAGPVLALSPALADADLIDAAIVGNDAIRSEIAGRLSLSASVCAALVEVASIECVVSLLDNPGAHVPGAALWRAFERFPDGEHVREALLARHDLDPALRARLVQATASLLQSFVVGCGWMSAERAERIVRDSQENSFIIVAGDAASSDAQTSVARHLRESGQLTAALLLRTILSGEQGLFEASLAELTGIGRDRAGALVRNFEGGAFAALYNRAGLPEPLLPVFRFALRALVDHGADDEFSDGGVKRALVEIVLKRCETAPLENARPVLGLLRRLHAEAARCEAREYAAWLARTETMNAFGATQVDDSVESKTGQWPKLAVEAGQYTADIGQTAVARALNLAA